MALEISPEALQLPTLYDTAVTFAVDGDSVNICRQEPCPGE